MSNCCPDLNIDITLDTFQFSGNTHLQSDSVNIMARGIQISSTTSFSTFVEILSGPGDFDSFRPFSAVSVQCFVTDSNLNLADLSITCKNLVGSSVD